MKVPAGIATDIGIFYFISSPAAYSGYVDVNWDKVKDDAIAKVDTVSFQLSKVAFDRVLF